MSALWYCARVKTTISWNIIIDQLRRQGFDGFEPIVQKTIYFSGKNLIGQWPLFEHYLFVSFDMATQRWRAVNSTQGVQYLLPANAEFPQPLPIGFVEELMSKKTEQKMVEVTQKFVTNDVVKILTGAWKGQTAKVISSSRKLTKVDVAAFNRHIVASAPTSSLAPG